MLLAALATAADAGRPRALVVATDFQTGILATVGMAAPHRTRELPTTVFSDAVVRVTGGYTIVLNRFLADNVQVLGKRLRTRLQCRTGAGSNPHDIVVRDARTAYVTRYGAAELWIVDPRARGCRRFRTGTIDLGAWADEDGLPEMDKMALVGTLLYVTLQRLDRLHGFVPTAKSLLVAIDTTTNTVVGEPVTLLGKNAFGDASGIVPEPGGRRLAVATPGDIYAVGDGGIGWIDPDTEPPTVEQTFFLTEDDVQGNVTDFVLVSPTRGYAIVQGGDLKNAVWRFDPTRAEPPVKLFGRDGFLPDVALAPDGVVWIADQSRPTYGVRLLDPSTDEVSKPIDVGLPPFSLGFLP
jgi:hypothetical protein